MLDSIPKSLWIQYWFIRNSKVLYKIAMGLVLPLSVGLYWPARELILEQERCITVHFSSLTVAYVLFLCYMGYFFQWLVRKYLRKYNQWVRLLAMFGLMLLLLAFLEFGLGIEMRWS